jgi:hypothetical protein
VFARLATALTLSMILGCGPFLLLPGGKLDGVAQSAPADWSIADEVDTVQLETNPHDPYSVNIWAAAMSPETGGLRHPDGHT